MQTGAPATTFYVVEVGYLFADAMKGAVGRLRGRSVNGTTTRTVGAPRKH